MEELKVERIYVKSMDESACNYNFTEDENKAMTIRPLTLSQFDLEMQVLVDWLSGEDLDWILYSS